MRFFDVGSKVYRATISEPDFSRVNIVARFIVARYILQGKVANIIAPRSRERERLREVLKNWIYRHYESDGFPVYKKGKRKKR